MRVIQPHHYISLVRHHTFLPTLEQPLLFHQFQGIKRTSTFESCQKNTTKTTSSNTLYYLEIPQLNILMILLPPNRLYLQQLPLEYSDRLASLEIVVLQYIPSPTRLPVTYTRSTEITIVFINK